MHTNTCALVVTLICTHTHAAARTLMHKINFNLICIFFQIHQHLLELLQLFNDWKIIQFFFSPVLTNTTKSDENIFFSFLKWIRAVTKNRRTAHTVRKEDTGIGIINLIYLIGIAFSLDSHIHMCGNGDTFFFFTYLPFLRCCENFCCCWDCYAKKIIF